MEFTREELKELILDALAALGPNTCPYCQAEILEKFIRPDDVSQWLDETGYWLKD